MDKELHIVMKELALQFGPDIISTSKFNGLIADMLGNDFTYAPIMKMALQHQVGNKVHALLQDKKNAQLKLDNIKQAFVAQSFVQPAIGYYIVDCFAFSIGLAKEATLSPVSANDHNNSVNSPSPTSTKSNHTTEDNIGFFGKIFSIFKSNSTPKSQSPNVKSQSSSNLAFRYLTKSYELKKDIEPFAINADVQNIKADANNGNADAQFLLALLYINGIGTQKEPSEAFKLFKAAADQGLTAARLQLATCLLEGLGCNRDLNQAIQIFYGLAQNNYKPAYYGVGRCYQEQDKMDDAIRWFKKAANAGDLQAIKSLGHFYLNGFRGIAVDEKEALKWFKKGADKSDMECMTIAGGLMANDEKNSVLNLSKAAGYLTKPASKGIADAQFFLGLCYTKMMDNNFKAMKYASGKEAEKWLTAAANQNHAMAQFGLACLYYNDDFVKMLNISDARKRVAELLNLAEKNGDQNVKQLVKEMRNQLSRGFPFGRGYHAGTYIFYPGDFINNSIKK